LTPWLRHRGLGIVLLALFGLSLGTQWFTHDGSITRFVNAVTENWQSEMLQLAVIAVLAAHLIRKRSPQSKDGDEATRRKLDRLEERLDRRHGGRPKLHRVA
jgi:hypothetical protein